VTVRCVVALRMLIKVVEWVLEKVVHFCADAKRVVKEAARGR
jgi:hypothetical protein